MSGKKSKSTPHYLLDTKSSAFRVDSSITDEQLIRASFSKGGSGKSIRELPSTITGVPKGVANNLHHARQETHHFTACGTAADHTRKKNLMRTLKEDKIIADPYDEARRREMAHKQRSKELQSKISDLYWSSVRKDTHHVSDTSLPKWMPEPYVKDAIRQEAAEKRESDRAKDMASLENFSLNNTSLSASMRSLLPRAGEFVDHLDLVLHHKFPSRYCGLVIQNGDKLVPYNGNANKFRKITAVTLLFNPVSKSSSSSSDDQAETIENTAETKSHLATEGVSVEYDAGSAPLSPEKAAKDAEKALDAQESPKPTVRHVKVESTIQIEKEEADYPLLFLRDMIKYDIIASNYNIRIDQTRVALKLTPPLTETVEETTLKPILSAFKNSMARKKKAIQKAAKLSKPLTYVPTRVCPYANLPGEGKVPKRSDSSSDEDSSSSSQSDSFISGGVVLYGLLFPWAAAKQAAVVRKYFHSSTRRSTSPRRKSDNSAFLAEMTGGPLGKVDNLRGLKKTKRSRSTSPKRVCEEKSLSVLVKKRATSPRKIKLGQVGSSTGTTGTSSDASLTTGTDNTEEAF
ncbi:hypothetical protein ADUPG1_013732 [Aduncisulcus paluster]|uniref:Uncharacterized protein n=1 Tax=Aduncisulcus paluster TaxID=2918883 RepID=A0ABQ5K3X7_9EUKA|nr:hypothetical protein ADUPG1_013732 [Aduncisulcus paluster]